ncbi:MAG: hypothetical protein Q4E34_02180 [Synergistaceae bacterium]|nr:hypothetical protein [Synergistaceae bacterium]
MEIKRDLCLTSDRAEFRSAWKILYTTNCCLPKQSSGRKRPLLAVPDVFDKIITERGNFSPWYDEDGILRISLKDFLPEDIISDKRSNHKTAKKCPLANDKSDLKQCKIIYANGIIRNGVVSDE